MKKIVPLLLWFGIIAALLAISFFVFQIPDFYPQVLAIIASAFLGAGTTAWVTNTLLDKQQKFEEEKEKNIKIYEEKLRIYQEFLKCLYEVIKDREVTEEEAIRLQFQTSYITMHTESVRIKTIAEQVKKIVGDLKENGGEPGIDKNSAEKKSKNNARLMECLFSIVEEFRKELYPTKSANEKKQEDNENIDAAVAAFSTIMDAVEVKEREGDIVDTKNDDLINLAHNLNEFSKVLHSRIEPFLAQWSFDQSELEEGVNISMAMKGYEEAVRVIFSYDDNGDYYFQVHLEHDDSHEVYKHMKWRFGGRQNKWCWWKYLDKNWRRLSDTQEIKTRNWDGLLEYLSKKLVELLSYVETFVKVRQEIYYPISIGKADKKWMYYNDVVAIDYPDNIFFDIKLHDNGYTIQMGNRNDDVSAIINKLKQLGFDVTEQELKSKRFDISPKELSAQDAVKKIEEYCSKL